MTAALAATPTAKPHDKATATTAQRAMGVFIADPLWTAHAALLRSHPRRADTPPGGELRTKAEPGRQPTATTRRSPGSRKIKGRLRKVIAPLMTKAVRRPMASPNAPIATAATDEITKTEDR